MNKNSAARAEGSIDYHCCLYCQETKLQRGPRIFTVVTFMIV